MSYDMEAFEKAAQQRIEEFCNPSLKKKRPNIRTPRPDQGFTVTLAVRLKRLAMDELFIFKSKSISRLEAKIEAEQAARQAGYPIVGYVVDIAVKP